jgi:chromosome segregation ATPase
MATSRTAPASADEATIEQLQERYHALHKKKIQAETNLENARKQLETLQREAREKYGTADIAELRTKLDAMKAENDSKRRSYRADLDRIEGELAAVEQKFQPAADNGEPA